MPIAPETQLSLQMKFALEQPARTTNQSCPIQSDDPHRAHVHPRRYVKVLTHELQPSRTMKQNPADFMRPKNLQAGFAFQQSAKKEEVGSHFRERPSADGDVPET